MKGKKRSIVAATLLFSIFFEVGSVFADTVVDRKHVSNQSRSNYSDSQGYEGSLSRYLHSGELIPERSRQESTTRTGHSNYRWQCRDQGSFYGWVETHSSNTNMSAPIAYSSGGYTGTLTRDRSLDVITREVGNGWPSNSNCTASNVGNNYRWERDFRGTWNGTVTRPEQDTRVYRYRGWVYRPVSDPSSNEREPGTGTGRVDGEFAWVLEKPSNDGDTRIRIINHASIAGNHYATRNRNHSVLSENGHVNQSRNSNITHTVSDPYVIKDDDLTFGFQYQYTNHYNNIYTCTDQRSNGCFEWTFNRQVADWSRSNTASWTDTLNVDHRFGEQIFLSEAQNEKSLLVGRRSLLDTLNQGSTPSSSAQYETITADIESIELETQTWFELAERFEYESDVTNRLHLTDGERWYFPFEIDENLRDLYENETSFDFSDYAIPMDVGSRSTRNLTFSTADNFFVTENTGFLFSLPRDQVGSLTIENAARDQYEDFTGETYDDNVFTSLTEGSRHYINIEGNSEQETDTPYEMNFIFGQMGLNDITVNTLNQYQFEHYLLGSVIDDVWIAEQQASVILDMDYEHSIRLDGDQMTEIKEIANDRSPLLNDFRSADIYRKYNDLQNVIPSLTY